MVNQKSLIEHAVEILDNTQGTMDLYELYDKVAIVADFEEEEKSEMIAQFYTDITTSAKFVYVGEEQWDLKKKQEIALWEKEGSFYKNDISSVDLEAYEEEVEETVEELVEEVIEDVVVEEDVVKELGQETEQDKEEVVVDLDEFIEEFDEEEDDFDEDKYNEYMDDYEDKYDF